MGDRVNFVFAQSSTRDKPAGEACLPGSLVLYSHWGGHDAGADLRRALTAARPRWDDTPYCTRICVSYIVGAEWTAGTGFGLSVGELGDNEHNLLIIDLEDKVVRCEDRSASFADFVSLTDEQACKFHLGKDDE